MKQKRELRELMRRFIFLGVFVFLLFLSLNTKAFASETLGSIDTAYKYAWGENIGWINFGCDDCNVEITDTAITGYAWSSQFGWINLNSSTAGVLNTATGVLSGRAWSSNLGWIDFDGVTINTSGELLGYATLDSDSSQISFNCVNGSSCASADFKVKTDWRPASVRTSDSGDGGSSGSRPNTPANPPANPPIPPQANPPPFSGITNNVSDIINKASDFISYLFNGKEKPLPSAIVEVPKIAPFAFHAEWNLLPMRAINSFVFAPLPYEIRILASKFPELDKTLKEVGVERFSDVNKLTGVSLNVPGLADILNTTIKNVGQKELAELEKIQGVTLGVPGVSGAPGKLPGNIGVPGISGIGGALPSSVGTGKIALIEGLPIAKFTLTAKKNLPSEFVFARGAGELVDLNVALSVGDRGEVTQRISSLPGKILKLVVKPISSARSVTGYIVFKAPTPRVAQNSILRSSLTASALFSMNDLVQTISDPIPVEKKLVLSSFEYTDPDKDGIYTADVVSPVVPGEYEIITVIDYIDPVLGSRKMSMVTVIDPEGYVFEKNNGKETRIPSAIVSLYALNLSTKQYEPWKAKDYSQENPQITDIRGTYSFLVPEGSYYFHVEAPGYEPYEGKAFVVVEGSGVHQNIELKSGSNWLALLDFQTVLLIVVCLLLVYNLYRNNLRDKLNKLLNKK
ncbi:MAG: carboxypeptidase-like regulatory domain-containing protein [Candidatus Paceibacterota bacterium]